MKQEESRIAEKIGEYLKKQYPNLIYRFDIADMKLTMGQAMRNKKLQMKDRGFNDLTLFAPLNGFHGMMIELKKDRSEVFKQNGDLKRRFNKKTGKCHNAEQSEMLQRLNDLGYYAVYGFGFEDTKRKIDLYLKGKIAKT